MRGNLPDALRDLIKDADTLHYTVAASIYLPKVPNAEDGALGRYLYLAASPCEIDGKAYDKVAIREISDQSRSIDRQTSSLSLQLENITLEMGDLFLKDVRLVQGAPVLVWRWYYENTDGLSFPLKQFNGVVSNVSGDLLAVKLDLTQDIYAARSFGGGRGSGTDCQAVYSSPAIRVLVPNLVEACGYDGAKPKCNHLLDHVDGCTGHGIPHRYQGMSYKQGKTEDGAAATVGDLKPPQNYGLIEDTTSTVMAMQPRVKFEGFTVTNDIVNRRTVISGGSGGEVCVNFAWNGAAGNEVDDLTARRVQTFKAERPGTLTDWGLYADAACAVTVDIRVISAIGDYPLVPGDSMPGSGNEPQITTGSAAEGDCSSWGVVDFLQDDIIEISISAVDTPPKYLAVVLRGVYTGCDSEPVVEACAPIEWTCPTFFTVDGNTITAELLEDYTGDGAINGHGVCWAQSVQALINDGDSFTFTLPNMDDDSGPEVMVGISLQYDCPACTETSNEDGNYCYFNGDIELAFQTYGSFFSVEKDFSSVRLYDNGVRTAGTVFKIKRISTTVFNFYADDVLLATGTYGSSLDGAHLVARAGTRAPSQPQVTALYCPAAEVECGAGWTIDLPNWVNEFGVDRDTALYDAMIEGEALLDADGEGFDFQPHTTDKLMFVGVMGQECPPHLHHELGNYDYWNRGLATQYAAVEFKADGSYEVWQNDEATGVTGSYADAMGFRIERASGGNNLNVYANGSLVFTTDLLAIDDGIILAPFLRIVALGGAAGAILEVL